MNLTRYDYGRMWGLLVRVLNVHVGVLPTKPRTIDRHGSTVPHTSRTNPSKMQKLPAHLAGKDFPTAVSVKD
ncbi:MAG: hypothetical protein ACLQPI_17080, partial [Limisphaerales bacterium]